MSSIVACLGSYIGIKACYNRLASASSAMPSSHTAGRKDEVASGPLTTPPSRGKV